MAFPTSPSNNQIHKEGNRAFVYDSALGTWDQVQENPTKITNQRGTISSEVTFPSGHVVEVKYMESTSSSGNQGVTHTVFFGFGDVISMSVPIGQSVIMQIGGGTPEFDSGENWGPCVNYHTSTFGSSTAGTFGFNTGTNDRDTKHVLGPVMAKYTNFTAATTTLYCRAGMRGWGSGSSTAAWYGDGTIDLKRFFLLTRYMT